MRTSETMKKNILALFAILLAACLSAQTAPFYIRQFDAAEGNTLCFDADSNLWVGCTRDRQPLLLKVTRSGVLLEQVALAFAVGQNCPLTELIVDADGMLVGCGVLYAVNPAENESSFIFRYNPATRQLLWNRRVRSNFFFARGILEPEPGAHYLLYGKDYYLNSDTEILTIHRQTGDIIPATSFAYKVGRDEDMDALIRHEGNLYATGRNDLGYLTSTYLNLFVRQGVWKIGSDGTPVWTTVGAVPLNKKTFLQGRDLLIENGAIYSLSSGNDQSQSTTSGNIFLQKTSLDGAPLWIRKYDITTFNYTAERGYNLIAVPDGFIIYGRSVRDFLLKTDKDGNLLWAQRLPTENVTDFYYRSRRQILLDGDGILVVSTLRDDPAQPRAVLMRIDLNGNIAGCNRLGALNAVEAPFPNPFWSNLPLQAEAPGAQSFNTPAALSDPAPAALSLLCESAGPVAENPCIPAVFLKKIADNAGQHRLVALAAGGDTLFSASENGLVTALDLNGLPRWSVRIETQGGGALTLTDMLLDSDGLLAVRGKLGQNAFACRLDPVAQQLLWSQVIPTLPFEGGGILETAPGEAYLLHHNLQLAGGRQVPETFQLNRVTGAMLALSGRRYDFDLGNQSHLAMTRQSTQLYASGRQETAAGPRLRISRLDANFGGPVWSQWGHTGAAGPGVSGGAAASVYDDDHLLVAYTGSEEPAGPAFGKLFLQKINPMGSILWVRRYDLPILGELDITAWSDGYVLMGKTTAGYLLIKTDRNGNLLLVKNIAFGAGTNDPKHPPGSRLLFHKDFLWLALFDDRPGQTGAWLLKANLNLETAAACTALTPVAAASTQTVINPVGVAAGLPAFVTPLGSQVVGALASNDSVGLEQICPPVYVEPTLELGPDRSICSLDTAVLSSNAGFKAHIWQDGLQGPAYAATTSGRYWLQARTLCDNLQTDTVEVTVSSHPTRTETLAAAPGVPVNIQGAAYFAPDSVTVRKPSGAGICDTLITYYITACTTVQTTRTVQFYPGQTVQFDGVTYSQPGVYTNILQTVFGCDSLVTYNVEWILTDLSLQCPSNWLETAADGQWSVPVQYDTPVFSTNCAEPGSTLTRITGPASGSNFNLGTTEVCYRACNGCGICDTCYFTVTILPATAPCDVKAPGGCVRYELLGIYLEANGAKRYRMRIVNECAVSLDHVSFQLPNGLVAQWPANNAAYTAPSGNVYQVRNPNVNAIRFRITDGVLSNGGADILEYVLPPQAEPAYIYAAARLNDGSRSATHLSALGCPPVPWAGNREVPAGAEASVLLRPNPAVDYILVELPRQDADLWQLQIADMNGRIVFAREVRHDGQNPIRLDIRTLPSGAYHCAMQSAVGFYSASFVISR